MMKCVEMFPCDPDKRKRKEKPTYRTAKYSLEYAEWVMMKCVKMGGHFSTHVNMCPSNTTLSEEDPACIKSWKYCTSRNMMDTPMFN